jgi:hypothetical protein
MILPKDTLYFLASYIFIIVGGFLLINFLSGGYLTKFLRVKASRGGKILVKVHNKLKTYCVLGWLEGEDLLYFDNESKRNKQKTPKRVTAKDRDIFYRFSGVWAVDVDEATNNVFKHDGSTIAGFDVIRWNNLYLRALMKPAPEDKDKLIAFITLALAGLCLLLIIVVLVKFGGLQSAVNNLGAIKSASVSGTNIV